MATYWYVCDGRVEEYRGQGADWQNSALVVAASPEEALLKVMKFHQGKLPRVDTVYDGRTVAAIV